MKRLLIILSFLLTGTFTSVHAGYIPATWSDTFNYNKMMDGGNLGPSGNSTVSWLFDITDDGFTPLSDIVLSYDITLNVRDDIDQDRRFCLLCKENAFFDQPGFIGDKSFEIDYTDEVLGWSLAGLIDLNLDGTMGVSLTATRGDFWFNSATLDADGKEYVSVPEPAMLSIFGAGLLGLGFARRFKNKKA